MRKLTILFALLTMSVGLWAQEQSTIIEYHSPSKLPEATGTSEISVYGLKKDAFNVPVLSHDFANSIGIIAFDGVVTTIGKDAFSYSEEAWWIEIPSTVVTIGEKAFANCSGIAEVTIPAATTTIDQFAFLNCTSLKAVHIKATTPPSLGQQAFHSCSKELIIYVPYQSWEAYQNAWDAYKDIIYPEVEEYKEVAETAIDNAAASAKAAIDAIAVTQPIKEQAKTNIVRIVLAGKIKISGASPAPKIKELLEQTLAEIALVPVKVAAIADIQAAGLGIQNTELNLWIEAAINDILGNGTTDEEEVDRIKGEILKAIHFFKDGKAEGKAELIGTMAEPCTDCTAVEVTDGTTTVTLYKPQSVKYIKK